MVVKSLTYLANAHLAELDAAVNGFEQGLNEVVKGLNAYLIDVVTQQPIAHQQLAVRQIAALQTQLKAQLTVLGYDSLAAQFIETYDKSLIYGQTVLENLGKPDVILSPMRADTLRQLKQLDLSYMSEIGTQGIQAVAKELTLNTLVGKKRSSIIKDLEQVLDTEFAKKANKYADTALRVFDRTANDALWSEAGIDKYRYAGPVDKKTRLWCKTHVGKVYNREQLDSQLKNDKGQLAKIHGGGWRCRHSWLPLAEIDD